MRRNRFTYLALYDVQWKRIIRNKSGTGWCTTSEEVARQQAERLGYVVVPVQVWLDHRDALRNCLSNDGVRALIEHRTGWRLP